MQQQDQRHQHQSSPAADAVILRALPFRFGHFTLSERLDCKCQQRQYVFSFAAGQVKPAHLFAGVPMIQYHHQAIIAGGSPSVDSSMTSQAATHTDGGLPAAHSASQT